MATAIKNRNDTLINRGLSINMRSINSRLTNLFQRYSIAINKINGGELFGRTQTRQLQGKDGIAIEYDKGKIVFKNSIDKFQFLMFHRKEVGEAMGIDPAKIYKYRRDVGKVHEYLAKQDGRYELGTMNDNMQMYISKYDDNVGSLDQQQDWVDYIMTQTWIDKLAQSAIDNTEKNEQERMLEDYRIQYLSDMIQGMVTDHEIDFHQNLDKFDESKFLDSGRNDLYIDAYNRLNSFGKLNYIFYEIFKPIGNSTEKYIKVKLSTNGELDISGVLGLSDCEHVDWKYGSLEYLRSMNTGNQKYEFNLSIPFNDMNSIMWWKPDEPEQLEVEEQEEGEITEPTGFRYYKPYETERFLRWFGTNFVPMLDLDTITKKTVCQSPKISGGVNVQNFHSDATNISAMNSYLARVSMDTSESQSLLTLNQKATIDIENRMEPPGQYLTFIVSGNQQTSNLSFRVTGKMLNVIQEMNHFAHTWGFIQEMYRQLSKQILFLTITMMLVPAVIQIWDMIYPDENIIPQNWEDILTILHRLQTPTVIDLLRFRQIDFESIAWKVIEQEHIRNDFITKSNNFIEEHILDPEARQNIENLLRNNDFLNRPLYNYIQNFGDPDKSDELRELYSQIPMAEGQKLELIKKPLYEIYGMGMTDEQQKKIDEERKKYEYNFDDVTVEILRERIETFNNLIVRLPVNTYHNRIASKHIFLDWKAFVDGAAQQMVKNGESSDATIPDNKKLYVKREPDGKTWLEETGIGTEHKVIGGVEVPTQKEHKYTELYTDQGYNTPLIDYSYCKDDDGNIIHDRWDYWSVDDFK